jgi:DNA invertase Pin-like site-specific DNA recombinase
VIYARFSSPNQREASIEQQIEMCSNLANRNGMAILDTYSDKAISGKTDNRPAFQRMMRDAKHGKFDVVIAWKSN